jgi:N-acetylneuraminic acid mutarotase
MRNRGRVRAPVPLLIAACLGLTLFTGGQFTAAAQPPPPATALPSADGTAPADYTPAGCNTPDVKKGFARCFAMVRTHSDRRIRPDAQAPPSTALSPADIRQAYHLPDGGEGRTVAIVDANGDSHAEQDLAAFRSQYGLPACTTANGCFRQVDQRGGADFPADDPDWGMETSLDLDAVSAVCPACHILLVQADSASVDDLGAGVDTAVSLGAKYVSNSYGVDGETSTETAYDQHYDHPGVAVAAATGDQAHVQSWPATNPNVIAVGGTKLTRDAGSARGWNESAWAGGGSGCSLYEPQPAYQAGLETGCDKRATADIAADADPASGLAVYDTLGADGWLQVGGTSLATPLVTAMYALAGTPAPDTYPVTYPYIDQKGLFDVTQGTNASCGDVTCTAGPGYDGPTGLGTPDGVGALAFGAHGTVTGRITDAASHDPVTGAAVEIADTAAGRTYHATTDGTGHYSLPVAVGHYDVTATMFGYHPATLSGVSVTDGNSATADLALTPVPSQTLSGTVTDNAEHGWPLYAKITVDGYPHGAVYTDPYTGRYTVNLPEDKTYSLHVAPVYPGYGTADLQVPLGDTGTRRDVAIDVDRTGCTAPGYAYPAASDFEGWTGPAPRQGWSVTDSATSGFAWEFDDPDQQWNLTGGSGNFAVADPFDHGGAAEDTELVSPVMDMSHQSAELQFDAAFLAAPDSTADVGLSVDGGTTWTTVWHHDTTDFVGHVDLPVPQAAGHSRVKVRFHFAGQGLTLWELDNVRVGTCVSVPGGLVAGTVTDGNTHAALDNATVTDHEPAGASATSTAMPGDTAHPDGLYWLFADPAAHSYTTAAARYTADTATVDVAPDRVNRHDVALRAGRLTVHTGTVSLGARMGRTVKRKITLTNTGRAPLRVTLGEQNGDFTSLSGQSSSSARGAAPRYVKGIFTPDPLLPGTPSTAPAKAAPRPPAPAASTGPWAPLADYPEPVMDNAVGYDRGRIYSVGGVDQILGGKTLAHGYVYEPSAGSWKPIADLPQALEAPTAAFLDGTMYVAGGWDSAGIQRKTVYAYHPATDRWTRVADLPQALSAANVAVLGGRLYIIGGCVSACAEVSATVYSYDPAADTWTRRADYPTPIQWGACAGIAGEIACAGGEWSDPHVHASKSAYLYHPATDTWTQAADMPYAVWGTVSSGANDELQVVGGVTTSGATNQAVQYDPVTNSWSALPNADTVVFRGGGASCGLYRVGGSDQEGFGFPAGTTRAEVLPGYDQCGGDDVAWLSESGRTIDLAPGHSATVTVSADTSAVAQPGQYTARLTVSTDTPYTAKPVQVALRVTPPKWWDGRH